MTDAHRPGLLPSPGTARLAIVVVSWNTRELLQRCLASLSVPVETSGARMSPPAGCLEVTVVDNASADGSAAMVRERFPWVRLVANPENVGFARANNQAIPGTTAPYVLLLNPDTELRPGALEALLRFMEDHPEAGAAGARLEGPDGALQVSCQPAPTLAREVWRLFHLDTLWQHSSYPVRMLASGRPCRVDVAQGACLILRRQALDQVGLLDEDYFIYSEEVDLCHRLRQGGWSIWWVPEAVVVHHGGQSTRQVARAMFLRLYQGKVLYFRKNHGHCAARIYKGVLFAAAAARLAVAPLAWLHEAQRRNERLVLAGHYRRLVAALPSL